MSHESAPGHGADSSPPHPPENTDEISDWVSGALHEVSEIQLEAQRPAKMTMVQTLVSDRDTARSLAELDRLIRDEADPVMRGQMQCQRAWLADRLYAERVAAGQKPAHKAEARAALDLNTTTPESVSSPINAGAAPMVYELTWAKELEGTVVEVGS